jgi:hypothetical protein
VRTAHWAQKRGRKRQARKIEKQQTERMAASKARRRPNEVHLSTAVGRAPGNFSKIAKNSTKARANQQRRRLKSNIPKRRKHQTRVVGRRSARSAFSKIAKNKHQKKEIASAMFLVIA